MKGVQRTIEYTEHIDTGHSKAFADAIVGMSKLPLHDSQVDLDKYNAPNTTQYHPVKLDVSFDMPFLLFRKL